MSPKKTPIPADRVDLAQRTRDLAVLLDALRGMYQQLFSLIDAKMSAMRAADLERLQALTREEQELSGRLRERLGLRRQLMELVAGGAGFAQREAKSVTLSQLASRLPGPLAGPLEAARAGLREAMSRAAQANRVCGAAARELLQHMHWIFASVRPQADEPAVYSRNGATAAVCDPLLIDALG